MTRIILLKAPFSNSSLLWNWAETESLKIWDDGKYKTRHFMACKRALDHLIMMISQFCYTTFFVGPWTEKLVGSHKRVVIIFRPPPSSPIRRLTSNGLIKGWFSGKWRKIYQNIFLHEKDFILCSQFSSTLTSSKGNHFAQNYASF